MRTPTSYSTEEFCAQGENCPKLFAMNAWPQKQEGRGGTWNLLLSTTGQSTAILYEARQRVSYYLGPDLCVLPFPVIEAITRSPFVNYKPKLEHQSATKLVNGAR